MAKAQPVKLVLMAELTWAKLYTKAMHKDLGEISTAPRSLNLEISKTCRNVMKSKQDTLNL